PPEGTCLFPVGWKSDTAADVPARPGPFEKAASAAGYTELPPAGCIQAAVKHCSSGSIGKKQYIAWAFYMNWSCWNNCCSALESAKVRGLLFQENPPFPEPVFQKYRWADFC